MHAFRSISATVVAAVVLWGAGAIAALAEGPLNVGSDGVAMDGFDVVAYFSDGAPAKGTADHSVTHEGATWHFTTAEHAAAFAADPAAYAPKYNGWCAFAMSEGYGAEVDFINGWSVIDGALYLNWDEATRAQFLTETGDRIPAADANAARVLAGIADGSAEFYRHSDDPSTGIVHPQQLH